MAKIYNIFGGVKYDFKDCATLEEAITKVLQSEEKDLRYANMRNANMSNADMSYANMSNADMSYANLHNTNMHNVDMRYANMRNANMSNANMSNADMSCANMSCANMRYANMCNANMRNADMCNADMYNVDMRYADMRYADIRYADMRYADMRYANMLGGQIIGFYKHDTVWHHSGGEYHIHIGCHKRSVKEWFNDFWNNVEEFPNDDNEESYRRYTLFNEIRRRIRLHAEENGNMTEELKKFLDWEIECEGVSNAK